MITTRNFFRQYRSNSFKPSHLQPPDLPKQQHLLSRLFSTTAPPGQFNRTMTLPPSERNTLSNQPSSSSAYTHFLAFPLHCNYKKELTPAHEQLRENLQILGETLNENVDDDKQKWKMKSYNGLHITLYLLTLKDEEDRVKAVEVLKELDFYRPRGGNVSDISENQKADDHDNTIIADAEEEGGGGVTNKTTNNNTSQQSLTISLSTLKTFHPPTSPKSKITLHTVPTVDKPMSNSSNNTVGSLAHLHSIIHSTFNKYFPDRETRPWIPHVTVATQLPTTKRDKSSKSKQSKVSSGGTTTTSTTNTQGIYTDNRMVAVDMYNQQAQEKVLVKGLEIDRIGLFRMGAHKEMEVLDENGCVVLQGGDYPCIAERRL